MQVGLMKTSGVLDLAGELQKDEKGNMIPLKTEEVILISVQVSKSWFGAKKN